jgi:hypothetical protein
VAETVIVLRRLRRGRRGDELLATVAERLGTDPLEPGDDGAIPLRFDQRGPAAWEAVRDALEAAGSDWREWVHLAPRPRR